MKKRQSISGPPVRIIKLFEKNLISHVPILQNLKFSLNYLIVRKPLREFEIEVHFILNTRRSYFLFMGKPIELKRDLKYYSMIFSIDKVRFIFPNETHFKTKSGFPSDSSIEKRISVEYFAAIPDSYFN